MPTPVIDIAIANNSEPFMTVLPFEFSQAVFTGLSVPDMLREAVVSLFGIGKAERRPVDMRASLAADSGQARVIPARINTPLAAETVALRGYVAGIRPRVANSHCASGALRLPVNGSFNIGPSKWLTPSRL